MRFFLDANLPSSSKEVVQKYGRVDHARDIGMAGATDGKIIEYATKNKAILVTKDLDFANQYHSLPVRITFWRDNSAIALSLYCKADK